jgi:quinol-cytochrome oxidoreductase complex cytochrome b subunit
MEEKGKVEGWPFIPNHLLMEAFAAVLFIAGLVLISAHLPWPVGEPADPFTTMIPIFPEWYFLSVFGFLKLWVWDMGPIPAKVIGVVAPLIFGLFLFLLPFWDKGEEIHPMKRKRGMALMVITIILLIFLAYYTIITEVS